VNKLYSMDNLMAPLWIMYSHISRYSIGWRMGYGENYVIEFTSWYSSLNIEEKNMYQKMFPEPKGWLGWYKEEHTDEDIYDDYGYLLWNEDGNLRHSLDKLQEDYQKYKRSDYLFFWGHQPSDDGNITKTCFSQWWKAKFEINTDSYCCMEQYMMAEKARLFKDDFILDEIMKSDNPKIIKELGRKVKNFDEDIWKSVRHNIILNGNFAKFLQNENLRRFLIQTKDSILVEASPYDKIWGIGMSSDDVKIENPLNWKGKNLLGFSLMEVRDELTRVCENDKKLNLHELHEEFD
jgi:ribA/ribD-fused uncharacterized protein